MESIYIDKWATLQLDGIKRSMIVVMVMIVMLYNQWPMEAIKAQFFRHKRSLLTSATASSLIAWD
jgi:hypothetical protein